MTVIGLTGPAGHAQLVEIPIRPEPPQMTETLCYWLLTSTEWHPWWTQYALTVVRLRDVPGMVDPHRDFPTATHRLIVMTLHPDTTYTPTDITQAFRTNQRINWVTINHSIDFDATDDEMLTLATQLVNACLIGMITPETTTPPGMPLTDDDGLDMHTAWGYTCDCTLAHIRGYHTDTCA